MPGFGDTFKPKIVESDEAIVARGGTPVPKEVRDRLAKGTQQGGIRYDSFVPPALRIRFRRFKAANFDAMAAEPLKLVGFDELAKIEWMNRAKNFAENDYRETQRNLERMKRNVK